MPLPDLIANAIPAAVQLCLAILMLRHNDDRKYPLFFTYTLYSVLSTVLQLSLVAYPLPYFLAHCIGEVLYAVLALLAIAEVFNIRLKLLYESHPALRYLLLPGTFLLMTGVGLWQGFHHPFAPSALGHFTPAAWNFVIFARCLESVLYFAAWALWKSGRMAMAERPFNILAGFGLAAFFSLVAYLLRYRFGAGLETVFRYMPLGAYIISTVLWLTAFLKPEPPKATPQPEMKKVLALGQSLEQDKRTFRDLKSKQRASTSSIRSSQVHAL